MHASNAQVNPLDIPSERVTRRAYVVPRRSGWVGRSWAVVPLVIPCELPTPDIVVVFPPGEGRVLMFVDPRVPFHVAADTIDRVRAALHSCDGRCIGVLAELAQGCVYALG